MLRNQFQPNAPYRCVIYARMSTDSQNPRSPDQQIDTITSTIRRLGLPWEVVADYRDAGKSGRLTRKRPDFQRMLNDLRSGAVVADLVLVDTFERLSRADDNAQIRTTLARAGVLVLTADSNFQDPTSVPGRALAMVESMRATEEGRVKAHNVLRGKKDAVRQGHWPGGPVPFGYRLRNVMATRGEVQVVDHRVLEPHDEERAIVHRIFTLAAEQTWGGDRIARSLNEDSDVPQKLKPFLGTSISYMFDNELYYGEYVWAKNCTGIVDDVRVVQPLPEDEWERNPEFCEGIVSRELWDRVRQIREQRRRRRQGEGDSGNGQLIPGLRAPGVALRYPLSGLVVCSECGRSMIASSGAPYTTVSGEERRYVSYACPASRSGSCSNQRHVPEEWLRETVMDLIRTRLFLNPVETG